MVFSHHHPDHTVNAALFPNARIHDHWAVYEGDRWLDRDAHGAVLAPSVRLLRTPGHTGEDISTIASTADGRVRVHPCLVVGATARRRTRSAPTRRRSRPAGNSCCNIATVIIPGHGAPFGLGARA